MLLSGVPALAVAQMASNPADTSAQRVAARVTSLAGFRPEKVQHGTQLVIAPFLEKLESMQLRFETGCGELPTFQAAWDEVLATPVVKKYIEMYEEAHIVGDEPSSALQQRVESMEKQLKTALEEVKRTRQRQPNQPATVAASAGVGDALSAKVAELMGRKDITDAEWSALSREERVSSATFALSASPAPAPAALVAGWFGCRCFALFTSSNAVLSCFSMLSTRCWRAEEEDGSSPTMDARSGWTRSMRRMRVTTRRLR